MTLYDYSTPPAQLKMPRLWEYGPNIRAVSCRMSEWWTYEFLNSEEFRRNMDKLIESIVQSPKWAKVAPRSFAVLRGYLFEGKTTAELVKEWKVSACRIYQIRDKAYRILFSEIRKGNAFWDDKFNQASLDDKAR